MMHGPINIRLAFVITTEAVRRFGHFIIIHTEDSSLSESLFDKQKKNKNITVLT